MNIMPNMKKSTILTKFFRRLGVWQNFTLLPKLSTPQKVVSNKQVYYYDYYDYSGN